MDGGRDRKNRQIYKLGPQGKAHTHTLHTHTHTHTHTRCQARFWLKSVLVIDSAGCSIHPSMNSQLQPVYNKLSLTGILLLELNRDHMMERLRADIKKKSTH